jgi:hypothetical protein
VATIGFQSGGSMALEVYQVECGAQGGTVCYVYGNPQQRQSCFTAKSNDPKGILPKPAIQITDRDDSNLCSVSREVFDLWLNKERALQHAALPE